MTEPYTAAEVPEIVRQLEEACNLVTGIWRNSVRLTLPDMARLAATLREYERVVKENAELRDDKERLDRFEATPSNLLVHAWDDGTHGFLWRPSSLVPWPRPSEAPWQDLRTALDYPYDAARAAGEG